MWTLVEGTDIYFFQIDFSGSNSRQTAIQLLINDTILIVLK